MESAISNTVSSAKAERTESKSLADKARGLMDSDLANQVSERWNQFRDRSSDVYNSSVDVVRRHPVATVGTALAVGVLAGMILKRRH